MLSVGVKMVSNKDRLFGVSQISHACTFLPIAGAWKRHINVYQGNLMPR